MSNFNLVSKDIGTLGEKENVVELFYKTSDKAIKKIKPSCSCVKVVETDKSVNIIFNTGKIPHHLGNYYRLTRSANIYFEDNTSEQLSVTVIVKRF